MKTLVKILIVAFVFSLTCYANAQKPKFEKGDNDKNIKNVEFTKKDLKKNYFLATYYFYNNEFGEALPIFQKLLKNDPTNSNLHYYIGVCYYHNNKYNVSKEYLTIAAENTSEKYKDSVFEKNAPLEVFSYLEFIENIELKN
jgi:tetratricopeptide (TPR) repeat protein